MELSNMEILELKENLKDIRVVYIADGESVEKNKKFFEEVFRQCYVVENKNDNLKMEECNFVPELIIMNSRVKGVAAENIIKSYLESKIVPEVMLLISEDTDTTDFIRLYNLGITNFVEDEFEEGDFMVATKKILNNLDYKRDKLQKENLEDNKRKKVTKSPQEMNVIILEKSIPTANVIKNLLVKNGAVSQKVEIFRTVESFLGHVKIQTKSSAADIVIIGDDDANTDISLIVKNIISIKPDTYMLTLSNEASKEHIGQLMSLGIRDVVVKPFEEITVGAKLDKALKLGEGQSLGLNRHLFNMVELVDEYKYFRFLRKLGEDETKLIEEYLVFLRRKK